MHSKSRTTLTTLLATALLASPFSARAQPAQDYCITFPGFNDVLVGRSYVMPKKNHCTPWIGFSPTIAGEGGASIGDGCLNARGDDLKFTIHTSFDGIVVTDALEFRIAGPLGDPQNGDDFQTGIEVGTPFFLEPPSEKGPSRIDLTHSCSYQRINAKVTV
jgi:hypothetical protein